MDYALKPPDIGYGDAESRFLAHADNIANIIAAVCSRPDSPGNDIQAAKEAVDLYLVRTGADNSSGEGESC